MHDPALPPSPRRGGAFLGILFWAFGIALLVLPFAADPDDLSWSRPDTTRKVEYWSDEDESPLDLPFADDASQLGDVVREEGWEMPEDPLEAILAASEERYGWDAEELANSDLFDGIRLEPGREVWERECIGCHGPEGDGAGPAASLLKPRPRNLRKGMFKFKATPVGSRPLRKDLLRVVTHGLTGSSMPDFRLLSEERRKDVVEYVRWLAIKGEYEETFLTLAWTDEEWPDADEVQDIVESTWRSAERRVVFPSVADQGLDQASIDRGRELFRGDAACSSCHGDTGRGDGPTADAYMDGWGYPIRPRDLSLGTFRVGPEPESLWRVIATGIEGTPMPGALGNLSADQIWDLVHYVQFVGQGGDQ